MLEYLTQALVLGRRSHKESDLTVDLFTKDFGRLEARVIGGRRITSKLSPHLDVFNLATVRLAEKNRITVTDAFTERRFGKERRSPEFYPAVFRILSLVRALTPKAEPDLHLWHSLVKGISSADGDIRIFLKILGYDPRGAECDICHAGTVLFFRTADQSFFCAKCGLKMNGDGLIYF